MNDNKKIEKAQQYYEDFKTKEISLLNVFFVGPDGNLCNKLIMTGIENKQMDINLVDGISVNGQLLDGWKDIEDAAWLLLIPDLDRVNYFTYDSINVACMMGSFLDFSLDSRECVKRAVNFANDAGFVPFCGSTVVYEMLGDNVTMGNSMMKMLPNSTTAILNREITSSLLDANVVVEYYQTLSKTHSAIDLLPTEFLYQLDNHAIVKSQIEAICNAYGIQVDYNSAKCPTRICDVPVHLSLWNMDKNKNLFFDPDDAFELSDVGKSFIAGIIFHSEELSVLIPQDNEKPLLNNWEPTCSINRDSAMIHVPVYLKEKKKSDRVGWGKRILFNGFSNKCNLYLSAAAVLIAGVDGIRKGLTLDYVNNKKTTEQRKIEPDSIFRQIMGNSVVDYLEKQNEKNLSV